MTEWARVRAELGPPHLELGHEDLERFRSPIVYVWTRGEEVLYVGSSINGVERPLAKGHERLRAFRPGDTLTVWRTEAPGALEAELIEWLRPTLNRIPLPRRCERCGRPRRSARYCAVCHDQVRGLESSLARLEEP